MANETDFDIFTFLINSNTTTPNNYSDVTTPPWASIVAKLIICIIGVIGNIMVIVFILILQEYNRAASHWYVLQLAIADLIFLLTLPFKISEEINDAWIYSAGMCKAKETILFLNYNASMMFLTIMSIDRYVVVCRSYPSCMKGLRFPYIVTFTTWIVALLLCTPIILQSNLVGSAPGNCKCSYIFPKRVQTAEEWCLNHRFTTTEDLQDCLTWAPVGIDENICGSEQLSLATIENELGAIPSLDSSIWEKVDLNTIESENVTIGECRYDSGAEWKAYIYFNFVVMFMLPFIIISICYFLIGVHLKKTLMATSARVDSERKKITTMCAVLVGVFVICWLPFHAIHVSKISGFQTGAKSNLCASLSVVTSIFAYSNAAINPYLYNFIGSFKKRIRQIRNKLQRTSSSGTSATRSTEFVSRTTEL